MQTQKQTQEQTIFRAEDPSQRLFLAEDFVRELFLAVDSHRGLQGPATVYPSGLWLAVVSCCKPWRAVTGCRWLPLSGIGNGFVSVCCGRPWPAGSPHCRLSFAPPADTLPGKNGPARRRAIELGPRFLTWPNPTPEALPGATASIERRVRSRLGWFAEVTVETTSKCHRHAPVV